MTGRQSLEPCAAACAAAAVLICGWSPAARPATTFVPSIGAVAAWTDNIDLASPGQEQSGEIWDVQPELKFVHDSAREHASLDYTLHALFFNGGHHDFLHSGTLVSTTQVIPDWFELDLSGQRSQGVADPALAANNAYLIPVSNLANFTSGLVRPILKHAFHAFQIEASYTRGITESGLVGGQSETLAPGEFGSSYRSNERDAAFTVSSVDKNARLTWTADYQRNQSDYSSPYSLRYLYEQANAELGLLTVSTLRVIARGGKESDPQNGISQGGLAATYWEGGIDWSDGPRDDLRLLVGHRFFGRTYAASWRRESRLLKLQVSYTEQPTTQDAQMLQAPLASSPQIVQIPGTPGFTRLSPDIYLDKALNAAATITGRVTEIGLSITSDQRTYYAIASPGLVIIPRRRLRPGAFGVVSVLMTTAAFEDRERSATLYATRRLGPLMSLNLSASYGKDELRESAQSEYDTQLYSAVLNRQLGERSSVYLRAEHVKQYGGVAEYNENVVSVGFNVSFGSGPAAQSLGSGMGYGP